LLDGPSENRHPTNVALLMFSYKVNAFFPEAYIDIVTIPVSSGEDIVEKNFKGPLQFQLKDALFYLQNNVIAQRIIKVADQAEAKHVFNYPYEAFEELLPNAVYHRSYEIREPVTVTITPGYVEIKSYPGFDHTITNGDIRSLNIRSRKPYRNRSIGNYLKDYRLTEGHNTGIPRAVRFLKENGSPMPLFLNDPERSSLIARLYPESSFSPTKEAPFSPRKKKSREELRAEALSLLSTGDYSALQIAKKIGLSQASKSLKAVLDGLIEEGMVKKNGLGKATRYELERKKV